MSNLTELDKQITILEHKLEDKLNDMPSMSMCANTLDWQAQKIKTLTEMLDIQETIVTP